MDKPAFAELLTRVQARPRMWLADERFTTFVAFVDGADAASGGELLAGFRESLAAEYGWAGSSYAWWGLIVERVLPDRVEFRSSIGDLGEEESGPLNAEMFDRLVAFLSPT